jgi:phenylalanyl-tRNA synthetase beta chain
MEYSLQSLTKQTELNEITLENIVNKLNLIGFEVDDIIVEPLVFNQFINDIRLLLKIPANREDLLTEILLLKEFSTIFSLKKYEVWKSLKNNYSFLLKQKYLQFYTYESSSIISDLPNISIYNTKLENFNSFLIPLWVKEKLKNFGYASTNNLNDILNLVCLEWGQQFDTYLENTQKNNTEILYCERLKETKLFIDLNKNQHILPIGTIVLKDSQNNILNILGLSNPIIQIDNDSNKSIVLETIFYDINLNLLNLSTINTTLSFRYLRKVFLNHLKFSFQRLLTLLEILSCSNNLKIEKYSNYSKNIELKNSSILKLKKKSLLKTLNIETYNLNIFEKAGLKLVGNTKNELYFIIPNSRKDLGREIDLIEEYCRFVGYENFKEIIPKKENNLLAIKKNRYQFIKEFFLNFGFNEIINSSLREEKKINKYSILLNNPLNNDFFLLRTELVSKIIENFENNLRSGYLNNSFFEIGRSFKNINGKIIEEDKIAGIFQSSLKKEDNKFSVDWFINKAFFENFFKMFGYENVLSHPIVSTFEIFHPKRSIIFKSNNKILGVFGEIHPKFNFKIPVYLFEFNLKEFSKWRQTSTIINYQEYSKYPSIIKDISFIIDKNVNFEYLKNCVQNSCENLKNIYFFDIYFDPMNLEKINIGIRLEFQSFLETLTNEQIEIEIEKLKQLLINDLKISFKN